MLAADTPAERRVLLIEDNPDHALLVTDLLSECPYITQVTTLADGAVALRFVEDQPASQLPAAVLLDLKLPKVDGTEILRAIRALPAWRQVPVIILTTSTARADVTLCQAYGATAYLTKMVAPAQLGVQIRQAMDKWVAHRPRVDDPPPPHTWISGWQAESGY